MSPIRVQCETCNTRLRVRDPGFVGEVHACPRCGGMVLITATAVVAPDIDQSAPPESPAADPSEASPEAPTELSPPIEERSLEPDPQSESAAQVVERSRVVKALAPAITAAALTVSAGLLWIAYGGKEANPPAESEAAVATDPIIETAVGIPTKEAPEKAEPEQQPSPLPVEPIETVVVEPTAAEIEPTQELLPKAEPVRVASAEIAEEPVSPGEVEAASLAEIDPLDFDPATIDLVLRRGGEPTEEPPTDRPPAPQTTLAPPTAVDAIDERLALAARAGGVSVRRGPTSDATNRPPTALAQELLAATIPAIDLAEIPLVDAIDLFAELSGAPITLSPQTLLRAGVEARRELEVTGEELALSQLLEDSLLPVRLELRADGPHAWLRRIGSDEVRTITHRIGDLADSNEDEFFALLEAVGPTDLVLPAIGGGERLPLEARGATHYELLLLCERLRVARGKPTRTKYPRRLLQTEPSMELLAKTLERRTTFSFVEPTPLREVIAHWRRATGRVVLVDWRSLGKAGLGPRSTIECAVTNRPWAEALDGVLEPLGLDWAAVGETLWISSADTLTGAPLVEFYPIARARGDDFASRLTKRISPAGVVYDAASGAAIIRGDAAAQRAAHGAWRTLAPGQ